jgi:hypothetical protein
MPAQAIASRASRQIVSDRTQTCFIPLNYMIDFPASICSLAVVASLSQSNRITAEVAVTVCLVPNFSILRFSHTDPQSISTFREFSKCGSLPLREKTATVLRFHRPIDFGRLYMVDEAQRNRT